MKYLIIICAVLIPALGFSHEGHGFKHAQGTIGPAISGRYCSTTQVWALDKDGDGEVDECVQLIFTHDKLHVKSIPITNGKCECPE